jgi:uncharacterized protein YqgC (DUF456 family)
MDTHTALHVLAGVLILVGLLGTVLPVLPGLPLMYGGMFLAAWNDGFQRIGTWTLVILGGLVVVSLAVDVFASIVGAKRVGASNKALWGAALGGLVGVFFGLPGLLLGPFLGAVGGEMAQGAGRRDALKVGAGTWVGIAVGAALKVALAIAMLGVFAIALFVD